MIGRYRQRAGRSDEVSMRTLDHSRLHHAKTLPRLLAIKQAIYELGISRTAFYELVADEKLKTVKIERRRLVPLEAIEEFIAGLGK
jgi:excisionase family DNA binding protein